MYCFICLCLYFLFFFVIIPICSLLLIGTICTFFLIDKYIDGILELFRAFFSFVLLKWDVIKKTHLEITQRMSRSLILPFVNENFFYVKALLLVRRTALPLYNSAFADDDFWI